MNTKKAISSFDLLLIANQMLQEQPNYQEGIRANDVSEKNGVLVFKGNYFLNSEGLPTAKTTLVFNLFKHLAHKLSEEFTLQA
jgi:hypothetical protein